MNQRVHDQLHGGAGADIPHVEDRLRERLEHWPGPIKRIVISTDHHSESARLYGRDASRNRRIDQDRALLHDQRTQASYGRWGNCAEIAHDSARLHARNQATVAEIRRCYCRIVGEGDQADLGELSRITGVICHLGTSLLSKIISARSRAVEHDKIVAGTSYPSSHGASHPAGAHQCHSHGTSQPPSIYRSRPLTDRLRIRKSTPSTMSSIVTLRPVGVALRTLSGKSGFSDQYGLFATMPGWMAFTRRGASWTTKACIRPERPAFTVPTVIPPG